MLRNTNYALMKSLRASQIQIRQAHGITTRFRIDPGQVRNISSGLTSLTNKKQDVSEIISDYQLSQAKEGETSSTIKDEETKEEEQQEQEQQQQSDPKNKGKSQDDIAKEHAVKKSLKTTMWQMFLVTFLGSSVLNIMRERNQLDELNDNYKAREKLMNEIIDSLKIGDMTIEEVREKLQVMNIRFEFFKLPISEFEGVEGLDKQKLKKLYVKYKGQKYIDEMKELNEDEIDQSSIEVTQEIKDAISRSSEANTEEKTHLGKFI